MATLVNGNGNPAVYAQQDADLYVGVMGTTSCIMSVGSKFAATIETANLISVADGVILTKEGRRIQTDVGEVDEFNIPNGAAGVTRYYIIGYHLYTDGQGSQKCETFVQLMSSATDTIPEAEFRNGATEVYVSLYRVTQVGLTLNDPESLLPDALNIGDINASLTENLDDISLRYNTTSSRPEWKERGADTWNPFSSGCQFLSHYAKYGGSYGFLYLYNSDGSVDHITSIANNGSAFATAVNTAISHTSCEWLDHAVVASSPNNNYADITVKKAGYYMVVDNGGDGSTTRNTPIYLNVNGVLNIGFGTSSQNAGTILYLGETNPFA